MFHRFGREERDRRREDALAVVVLRLLEEQMGTAIELVKRIEERFGGRLAFEPSEIYPMLQYLEDRGFVTQEPIGDRKVYAVTEAGFAYLAEQGRATSEAGAGDEACWPGRHHHGHRHHWHHHPRSFHEFHGLMHDAKRLMHLFKHAMRSGRLSPERMARLRAILDRAHRDIEDCLRGGSEHGLA